MSDDRLLALPMRSSNPVLPGEEVDVTARPTYAMIPDAIYFDSRSWVVRRAYFGGPGRETDLALVRDAEPVEASPSTRSPPVRVAPGARVPVSADLHLLVAYLGPDPSGGVFCGAVVFRPDWEDPYTSRTLSRVPA